jgi:hypothetical protein
MMDTIEQVESAFANLDGEYLSRKTRSERTVREWRWFDLRPLHFERHGFAPGRRLRQTPADRYGCVCCGFDEMGQVAVEREFNEFGFYETFYNWTANPIEVAHFDYAGDKKAINLLIVRTDEARVISSSVAATHGHTREDYEWDGSQVRQVAVSHARREQGRLEDLRPWHTARALHGDKGVVRRADILWPPAPPKQPE